MSKVLVLYYSTYGHIETMAQAVADGARATGATVDVKRVPETVPTDIAKNAHFKLDQAAPVATVEDLEHYDATESCWCTDDDRIVVLNTIRSHAFPVSRFL